MHTKKICYTVEQIDQVVNDLRENIDRGAIVTLSGLLGAGKTAFVQRLCASFGVVEPVVSPTYAYLARYEVADLVIYHFDLYRISGIEEFESFGFSECLSDSHGIVLIEWPERITSLLARRQYQEKIVALSFNYVLNQPDSRQVSVKLLRNFVPRSPDQFDD